MLESRTFVESEEHLHQLACTMTGLQDFGPATYRAGLKMLLKSLDADTRTTPMGREVAAGTIVGTLAARLYTQEGWRLHPHCLRRSIKAPLVITGIPRTGTTALHKLLSMDPQFQGLERWIADVPMPRPPRREWDSNPHYQRTVATLKAFFDAAPEMRAAHEMVADEVDECLELMKQEFTTNRFASGWYVPEYDRWFQKQNEGSSYDRFANMLRLIGAHDDRTWLLKNPGHIAELNHLFEIFPDARVVHTHRDPAKALPSLCSVLAMSRRMLEGDAMQPHAIGPRECDYWLGAVTRAATVRATRPQQFFDVDHRRFHTQPLVVVRELYEYFGLTLDRDAESAMREWIAANPPNRLGEHRYTADQFGLSAASLHESFRDYMRTFGLDRPAR